MFIVTAKLSKKKAVIFVLIIAVLLAAVIILAGRRDQEPDAIRAESAAEVAAYLESLGWQISPEPLEVQEILIPRAFDAVYEAYNAMQIEAGFDLTAHKGRSAIRFSWQVLNYPGQTEGVIAEVLVANGEIIGGDMQSTHLDGFIHGLFPNRDV
ncbi:MAG: DUF4830 domain-containing protein [Oscillospiraceae bacterium]|nr:DUF4830 domain-containing protein [Oscillospiraceae bacterium]